MAVGGSGWRLKYSAVSSRSRELPRAPMTCGVVTALSRSAASVACTSTRSPTGSASSSPSAPASRSVCRRCRAT